MNCIGFYSCNALDDKYIIENYPDFNYYLKFESNDLILCKATLFSHENIKTPVLVINLTNGDFDAFFAGICKCLLSNDIDQLTLFRIEDEIIDKIYLKIKKYYENIDYKYAGLYAEISSYIFLVNNDKSLVNLDKIREYKVKLSNKSNLIYKSLMDELDKLIQ